MRIIGEFNQENTKVTVMKMNDKTIIKFENHMMEQTYKFRDGSGVSTLEEAKTFCTPDVFQKIETIFIEMAMLKGERLASMYV